MDVSDFQTQVLERSKSIPVLVDFWAEWCGPCRVLGPMLERLAAEAAGRWELAKVDTEAHPGVAERYDIMSIPNVKLFVDGEVVDEFVGALPEAEVRRWLEEALPSPHRAAVAEARALLDRGAWNEAIERLRPVLGAEPVPDDARIALAEAQLHVAPAEVAATLAPLGDDAEFADRAEALRALARLAVALERPEAAPQPLRNPRLVEGARAVRSGDWAKALEAMIEVLRGPRGEARDAAREAARAIFLLLGHAHPVAERFHRALSGLLHA